MLNYKTVKSEKSATFLERKSTFIGHIRPAATEEEAMAFIRQIKSQHWDATHNVYAYHLRQGQVRRYTDDGEPSGTAGIPALDVLVKEGIIDAVVVITRYFGGILLGTGGLVRAYSHAAKLAIEAAGIREMTLCSCGVVRCSYHYYGPVQSLAAQMNVNIGDIVFGEDVTMQLALKKGTENKLEEKLADLTCGSVTVEWIGEKYSDTAQHFVRET